MELSEKPNAVTEEQIPVIEWFIGFVYYGRCCINSSDSQIKWDFEYSLHGNLRFIPSSRSWLKEHVRSTKSYAGWVNFQCVENICFRSPSYWVLRFSNGLFTSLWHSSEVAINADSLTATVGCSSQKCIKCKCTTFSYIHFASVNEIASTNLFRMCSLIFSDFADLSVVFIVCKYCYSLLKSSW